MREALTQDHLPYISKLNPGVPRVACPTLESCCSVSLSFNIRTLFLLVALNPKLGLDQYENGEYSCTYKFLLNKESLYHESSSFIQQSFRIPTFSEENRTLRRRKKKKPCFTGGQGLQVGSVGWPFFFFLHAHTCTVYIILAGSLLGFFFFSDLWSR